MTDTASSTTGKRPKTYDIIVNAQPHTVNDNHITFAGVVALAYGLWRRSQRLASRLPAVKAAVIAGVATAFGYALLAGFAVPACALNTRLSRPVCCPIISVRRSRYDMVVRYASLFAGPTLMQRWARCCSRLWHRPL